MDDQLEQGRQRVGLTINAPEKLSQGRPWVNRVAMDTDPKTGEILRFRNVALEPKIQNSTPTAEHKEPHRSE